MNTQGIRTGDTARLVDELGGGAKSAEELVTATGLTRGLIMRRLRQRATLRGDVEFVDDVWRICKRPAGFTPPPSRERSPKVALRKGNDAVKARAERAIVCEVATPRTYTAPGEYVPPRSVIRAGSLDYLATPTRVGDQRLPYQGAVNLSTTANAAGPRSGLK